MRTLAWLGRRARKSRPTPSVLNAHLRFYAEVVEAIDHDVAVNPEIEVGGKLVGRVRGTLDLSGPNLEAQVEALEIDVIASLDAGPGAVRSATYHLPDGEYQERLFRSLEREDPEVEHLGSWHSHHPNGYPSLSSGDVRGYLDSVNDERFNLDFFLATLVVDEHGFRNARHFLFVRDVFDHYFELTPKSIEVVRFENPYLPLIARHRGSPLDRGEERSSGEEDGESEQSSAPVDVDQADGDWWTTEQGKRELARDRRWILKRLRKPVAVCRNGTLLWKAELEVGSTRYSIEYRYPDGFPKHPPAIRILALGGRRRLEMTAELVEDMERESQVVRWCEVLRSVEDCFPYSSTTSTRTTFR